MSNNLYDFDEDFEPEDFDDPNRLFRERACKNPAAKKRLSDEANTYIAVNILKFIFVTIPLALLFAGLAVQPLFEAAWGVDLGYWTAFLLLLALLWLIPRPRRRILVEEFSAWRGR